MIPVLLVTGFLGSGKTTLIRHILADPAFARSAVIVNEWGEIGLDHELIGTANETLLELSTGCLCCRVSTDLGRTFSDLAARAGGKYERVLIETSGLADPGPIVRALLADPAIRAGHVLAGTLALIDARAGEADLARHREARRQAAFADRLLITKTDLVAENESLRATLAALNPGAPILTAAHGAVAPDSLFAPAPPSAPPEEQPASHSQDVTSFVLVRERPVAGLALMLLLQALAEHCGPRLLRVKGLVDVAEAPGRPALIQGVQHLFEPPQFLACWPGTDRRTRIVFIAEGVPRHWPSRLLAALEEEVAEEQAPSSAMAEAR